VKERTGAIDPERTLIAESDATGVDRSATFAVFQKIKATFLEKG
jgi:hypothetical protein